MWRCSPIARRIRLNDTCHTSAYWKSFPEPTIVPGDTGFPSSRRTHRCRRAIDVGHQSAIAAEVTHAGQHCVHWCHGGRRQRADGGAIPGAMDAPLDSALFWGTLTISLSIAEVVAFSLNR